MAYQRFIVNVTNLCSFHGGMDTSIFMVLPFHGGELVREFGMKGGTKSFRIFSKPSAINEFGMPLPTTV